MRVVLAVWHETGQAQAVAQLATSVDADVAADRVVVLLRERPVDPFGVPAGHRYCDQAPRAEHPG